MICFFNGKFISQEKAGLPLSDIGLLRGYGIFEYLRTYNLKPFKPDAHLKRFQKSAVRLHLRPPYSLEKINKFIHQLLLKNRISKDVGIRLILTGGQGKNSLSLGPQPTFAILIEKLSEYPQSFYQKGAKVITLPFKRFIPEVKSLSYIPAVLSILDSKKQGLAETLYLDGNNILEGATSNFFIVKKGKIITPKKEILLGITRAQILKLAKPYFKIEERVLKISELRKADETFLTATNKEIMPVIQVDNIKISSSPGRITQFLIQHFRDLTTKPSR